MNDAWLQFAEENPSDNPETLQQPKPADALIGSASGDGGSQQASPGGNKASSRAKRKKPLKISVEAMIRGFEKYMEEGEGEEKEESNSNEECHHNVAAWHNVPHP